MKIDENIVRKSLKDRDIGHMEALHAVMAAYVTLSGIFIKDDFEEKVLEYFKRCSFPKEIYLEEMQFVLNTISDAHKIISPIIKENLKKCTQGQ